MIETNDTRRCPKCGSTHIHAEKRGWSVLTGLIGSAAIVVTCLKCGSQFPPGQAPDWNLDARKKLHSPLPASLDDEEVKQLGITFDGVNFWYGTYRYDRLVDAVAYARQERAR